MNHKLSQLEHDLLNNARDRLRTWANDTMMRCNVVEVPELTQVGIIMNSIFEITAKIAIEMEMPYNDFQDILREFYDQEFKKKQRKVKDRA
jgi:hypothetical protein